MTDRPEQRPEGRLIGVAQKRPRLSNREAATRADMSEGHWRAIVSGSRSMGNDIWVPVKAPAETLARMAQVVGVTPEQLADVGRDDAAEALRELAALPEEPKQDLAERLDERIRWFEEDNARRQRENDERIRRLEDEVKRLREQRSG